MFMCVHVFCSWLAEQGGAVPDGHLGWGDVLHFVILPNYKEDPDILREAIDSCAASSIAKRQIGFVLAMEARCGSGLSGHPGPWQPKKAEEQGARAA